MIKAESLQFYYSDRKPVLNNISLNFELGNIYGLLGKNGEGKSTLMKIMSGLLFPKTGFCKVAGEDTFKRSVGALQQIFLVPEDFELPACKVSTYEKVHAPFYPKFSRDRFYDLLSEFKIEANKKTSTLSFGQKKKVLIAFGIATNTGVLLLDEPTNGLDIPSKSQFRKIMAMCVDQGTCIVISTHQVRDLHSLINHVVILDQSRVIFNHSISDIANSLCFGRPTSRGQETVVYSDGTFGGKSIMQRLDGDETEVDLELLCNAVINKSEQINSIIKSAHDDAKI